MAEYFMPCGCSWPIAGDPPRKGALPLLDVDVSNLPDCHLAWDIMSVGNTKGVFQLESRLGATWAKKLKPKNNEHLSALGALLRPGCLAAKDEHGVSLTEHYCRRVNKEEPADSFDPALDDILGPTEQILVYQEQSMQIGAKLAGFDLKEVDRLRKAIGKKDQKEMAEVKKLFLQGAEKIKVVSMETAETIWGWIEKSGRYQFNKSHSMSYGLTGYDTAYLKSHFPVQFYTSWLAFAEDKVDPDQEVMELVEDARRAGILVLPPDVRDQKMVFWTDGLDIHFGLSNIKGLGQSNLHKLFEVIQKAESELGRKSKDFSWMEWLVHVASEIPSVNHKLIMAGALDWAGIKRQRMLAEVDVVASLTKKEQQWILNNCVGAEGLIDILRRLAKPKKEGGGVANVKRGSLVNGQATLLENPPTPLSDHPAWMAWAEEQVFGFALTCSRVDGCDLGDANTTCGEFLAGKTGFLLLGVEVRGVRSFKTKKGTMMAFLSISDSSGMLDDVVCFSEPWEEFKHLLTEGNTILVQGERDPKKGSLVVRKVFQMS
jgi:DNA polymerase-3 subunit alpha